MVAAAATEAPKVLGGSGRFGREVDGGGAGWLGSALRRSSLDEKVVCGGQAWPAYQIQGILVM